MLKFIKTLKTAAIVFCLAVIFAITLVGCGSSSSKGTGGNNAPGDTSNPCNHSWILTGSDESCEYACEHYHCTECQEDKTEILTPKGHDWELTYSFDGNCETESSKEYECLTCGEADVVYGDIGDHSWYESENSFLCGTEGFYERICDVCGKNDNGITLGLSHDLKSHDGVAPTCTTAGYKAYEECTRCTYTTYEDLPATNHGDTKWVTVITPTETTKGVREYVCADCDYFERVSVPESIYTDGLIYVLSDNSYYVTGIDRTINPTATVISVPKTYNGKSVTTISYNAFKDDTSITGLDLTHSAITTIKQNAFQGCTSLTSVKLGAEIRVVESCAFDGSTNLTTVDFGAVSEILTYAFRNCKIESVTLPETLTLLDRYAFVNCTALTTITILAQAPKINDGVFAVCPSVESLTVPFIGQTVDSTKDFGLAYLFIGDLSEYAEGANQIYVPKTLKFVCLTNEKIMKPKTFAGCESIETIILSDNLEITPTDKCYDLSGCTSLRFNSYKNGLYIGTGKNDYYMLAGYDSADITSLDINPNTHIIAPSAFKDHPSLTEITIASSVEIIGNAAFLGCTALTTVTIDGNVQTIGANAFNGCTSLKNLTISSGVERIDNFAFKDCTKLTTVTLPTTINFIGYGAFYNSGLTKAYLLNTSGWYISGTGYITLPQEIAKIADPELLATRLTRNSGEYWKKG